ncbi:integrase core domain-containing protein [Paenarthrobacter nicotinovorans]|uniref:integrase core domain-containing protein n=1 Tax=Paenarthrobacter nicotinovorans TaxID=29320 RepID=UPI00192E3CD9
MSLCPSRPERFSPTRPPSGPWSRCADALRLPGAQPQCWPQANGKVEGFNRILLEEWAYAQTYTSEAARQASCPEFIEHYNQRRPHTALEGASPISRVTNQPTSTTSSQLEPALGFEPGTPWYSKSHLPLTRTPTFPRLFIKQNLNSTKRKPEPSTKAAAEHPGR